MFRSARARTLVPLALAIILAACCLRAPITCIGPLADVIQADLGTSSGATGTITTVPVLMFAAFSVVFGELGRRHPAGWVMVSGLLLALAGVAVRSLGGSWGLFFGTAVIGIGLTAGNVLIPAFIKAHYPDRVGQLTGAYTACMSLMSAVAGAVSVPLGDALGWRGSVAVWAVLLVITLATWLPHRDCAVEDGDREPGSFRRLASSRITWYVAMYMGLQSLIFYAFVAWISVIMQSKGMSAETAGLMNSAYMVLGIVGSLVFPLMAGGRRDLRAVGAVMGVMYAAGLVALMGDGTLEVAVGMLLCGICGGTCLTFPVMLFVLRTGSAGDASAVSGIGQSIGYLVASVGPVAVGSLFDATADWDAGLMLLAAIGVVLTFLGYVVGRDRPIS